MEAIDFQKLQKQFSEVQDLIKASNNSVLINQSEDILENIQEQLRMFQSQFQFQTIQIKQLISKTINEIHSFALMKGNLDQTSFISNLIANKRKAQQDFQRKIFQFGSMLSNLMKPKDITMSVMIGNQVIEVEDVVFVDLEIIVFWRTQNDEIKQQTIQTQLLCKELEQKNLQMYVSMLSAHYLIKKIKELKDIIKIPEESTLFQFDLRPKQKQIGIFSQLQYLIGGDFDPIALSKNMEININKTYQMKINYYKITEPMGLNINLLQLETQMKEEQFQTKLKNTKNFINITEKFILNDAPHNNVEIHLNDDKVSLSHLHIPREVDLELCLNDKFYLNYIGDFKPFSNPTLSYNEQLISRSNLLRFGLKLQDDIVVQFKVHLQPVWEGNGQL
ncbi:hypothetical protein pb186bvf_013317 [Paramecium bursaria]